MKVLVAIANYGSKNASLVERLVSEYNSMSYIVDITLLCETPKNVDAEITELVGLPTKDPWSLPFSHRQFFADRVSDYDVFIYSEDDMLIREENISAFLRASSMLPEYLIPGFVRYELYQDGRRNYLDIHGPFHWEVDSIFEISNYVVAGLSNEHSACYMLTQAQLQRAIQSGGYLVPPHQGKYDMLCAAATDPYTQCGFTRVICISHLDDFELHHLSNAYLEKLGLTEELYRSQIASLYEILDGKLCNRKLFETAKNLDTPDWDKSFYEACRTETLQLIPHSAKRILSVGCGSGQSEAYLVNEGKQVEAIPLDSVIGRVAESQGTRVLPPDFQFAFEELDARYFDTILMFDVLQHLKDPVARLKQVGRHLAEDGILVGSVPNLSRVRRMIARVLGKRSFGNLGEHYELTKLHLTSRSMLRMWLAASGFIATDIRLHGAPENRGRIQHLVGGIAASDIVFVARLSSP